MRDRIQLELTVSEYRDAKQAERQRTLGLLLQDLERARSTRPGWYEWLRKRREGIHDHSMLRAGNKPSACPVYGCHAVKTQP